MSDSSTAVAEPTVAQQTNKKPQRQPRYNVILWDAPDHSYDYVIMMLKELFRFPREKGFQMAEEVDTRGSVICLTTTREHAELKRDQIHSYGADPQNRSCKGSMSATIEPVSE